MLIIPSQPNEIEPSQDRKFNRKAGWASILSLFIGMLLYFAFPPPDTVKHLFWISMGLLLSFAGMLSLLIIASIKYHRLYKKWCSSVDTINITAEKIEGLKQDEVANKINNAFHELNEVVALSRNLHQEVLDQLFLLQQVTPESRKLLEALAELTNVIPSAKETAHELKILTGLFLQNAPEQTSQLQGLIYTLSDLTSLESDIPNNSVVVIRRPFDIRAQNNDGLTRIMETNGKRGIKYTVIGSEMPSQWLNIENLKLNETVDEEECSLVLPSLGLVLYIVQNNAEWERKQSFTWCPIDSKKLGKLSMGKVDITGFVLLPIPHKDGSPEHGYLALRMSGADIDELIHRIY